MRFGRRGAEGSEIPVVINDDGTVWDLRSLTADIDGEFLASQPVDRVRAARDAGMLTPLADAEALRVGAPIARPSAIICIGMNYAAHAAESGAASPLEPVIFLKTPNTVSGPFDEVPLPRGSEKTDWEVELAVVIGARASYLASPMDAARHIAGYTVANDLSERAWQLETSGGQWSKGKCAPRFSPLGPELVTADEISPSGLRLRSSVNGEPRQDSTTADLIFPVNDIVYRLSQHLTLEPGDVVLTGTPAGVALSGRFPYLRVGDVVEVSIDGLGAQRQVIA